MGAAPRTTLLVHDGRPTPIGRRHSSGSVSTRRPLSHVTYTRRACRCWGFRRADDHVHGRGCGDFGSRPRTACVAFLRCGSGGSESQPECVESPLTAVPRLEVLLQAMGQAVYSANDDDKKQQLTTLSGDPSPVLSDVRSYY